MNKFLDEDNIIKKENTPVEEDIDLGMDNDEIDGNEIVEEEITEKKPVVKNPTKKKIPVQKVEKKIIQPKSKLEIIVDMLNRYNEQLISKEVELDLYHYLYNNGGSNDERKRYEMTIKNLAKDIREMQKKIQFLNDKYNKEKQKG